MLELVSIRFGSFRSGCGGWEIKRPEERIRERRRRAVCTVKGTAAAVEGRRRAAEGGSFLGEAALLSFSFLPSSRLFVHAMEFCLLFLSATARRRRGGGSRDESPSDARHVAPPSPSDGCSEKREVEVPPPSGGLGSKLRGGFVSGSLGKLLLSKASDTLLFVMSVFFSFLLSWE
jgi:hypothetical protein